MSRSLVVPALAAALLTAAVLAGGPVRAGGAPEVTAVVEGIDTASGRGTLIVTGSKVRKFAKFTVRDVTGAILGEAEKAYSAGDLLVLQLPDGLEAGDYRLALEPKKGDALVVAFSYGTARYVFPAGRKVGIGTDAPLTTLDVAGSLRATGDVTLSSDLTVTGEATVSSGAHVGGDLDVSGGATVAGPISSGGSLTLEGLNGRITLDPETGLDGTNTLLASFESFGNAGGRLAFARSPVGDGIEIGQDVSGSFVVEDAADAPLLTLGQDGRAIVGAAGGSARLALNSGGYSDVATVLRARSSDAAYLRIERSTGAEQMTVAPAGLLLRASSDLNLFRATTTALQFWDVDGNELFRVNTSGLFLLAGDAAKPGGGSWASVSDARLKRDVRPLEGALDRLLGLRGVTYEFIDPAAVGETPGRHTGFVAQQVEEVLPEWVGERADGIKYVAPKGFEALAVTALRELRTEKDAADASLRTENAALRERVASLEERLARVEALLAKDTDAPTTPR